MVAAGLEQSSSVSRWTLLLEMPTVYEHKLWVAALSRHASCRYVRLFVHPTAAC